MKKTRAAMLALAVLLIPAVASAGLLGETVFLTLTSGIDLIFNNESAVVVDPGVEFTTTLDDATWTLDVRDNGFRLAVVCAADPNIGCSYPDGLEFSLSGLNFTPTGLTVVDSSGLEPDGSSPSFPPSSVSITFLDFELGTGASADNSTAFYEATFEGQPQEVLVSLPGTLALLSAGLGLAALALRRPRV